MKNRKHKKIHAKHTWVMLAVITASTLLVFHAFYFSSTALTPLTLFAVFGTVGILGVRSFQKDTKKLCVINAVLSVLLIGTCIGVFYMQKHRAALFQGPAKKEVNTINLYVKVNESTNLEDYANATFIVQSDLDQENQRVVIQDIKNQLGEDIHLYYADSVLNALNAFYEGKGEVLVLNEAFIPATKTLFEFANFDADTTVLYQKVIGEEQEEETTVSASTIEPFVIYIAGNDTREEELTLVGRTDMNMIVAVNPGAKQILMISIPRDFYIENPALHNGLDKLTHLGNHGIQNTLDGVNAYFGLSLSNYACTNFAHFEALVDSIGGITVDNPYTFTAMNEETFEEGTLTLNGEQALNYARERKTLSNGDYGRNEHQGIIMQAILEKIQTLAEEDNSLTLADSLHENFLTNMDFENLYDIYTSLDSSSWSFIRYHLGGEASYEGTISMGMNRMLYVCKPFESQVTFTREMVEKVLNGEVIEQEPLPDNDLTTFMEN